MLTRQDIVLAISYSGAAHELVTILSVVKRMGARLISITGNPQSELARNADLHLDAHVAQEACPLNLAPTASTTADRKSVAEGKGGAVGGDLGGGRSIKQKKQQTNKK